MLNIGIIGCGKIAEVRHAPEYLENPSCNIVGFFDEIPARAESYAEKFGGKAFNTIQELLNSGVDAVSVCTSNTTHAEISIQALNAGVHVLCEKPMATTLEDCQRMVEAAERNGKFLMIGQNQRLAKAHVKARKLIESGEIGKILTFRTTFGHPGPESWTGQKNSWFFDKTKAAFGAMADLGVHKTDLIHFLTGDVITEVTAQLGTLDKKYPDGTPISVDDNAYCIYQTRGGIIGTLHVSWTFYGDEDNSTVLYGTDGVIRCYDDPKYSLIVEKRDGGRAYYILDQMTSNKEQTSGARTNTGVIDAFVNCILTNTPPAISGREVMKAMKVIFAAEESAQNGKKVTVVQD